MARGRDREAGLIDMVSSGLSYQDLAALTEYKTVGAADPDAAPGLPDHPIVRLGDVWTLGDHRIICGDSTDPATVRRLLGADRPHLMVTDPPYGVEYSPDWRNHALRADGTAFGGRAVGVVANDSRVDWSAAWTLFSGDVAYVWHAGKFGGEVLRSLESVGLLFRSQIIWNKNRFVIGRGHYHFKHECAWYVVRRGATGHWVGGHNQSTVWDIPHAVSDTGHGTQKPIECMRRPIENNSQPGDYVYEPFSGSGTTIVAAELTGRRCLAVELNPLYAYVAIVRWQNVTGRAATLDGEPFGEVVRRRSVEPASSVVALSSEMEPRSSDVPYDFDPVLVEVICDRYCPPGGVVLDVVPSATRRFVFEHLRRDYRTSSCAADLLMFTAASTDGIIEAVSDLRDDRFAVAVVTDQVDDGLLAGHPTAVSAAFRAAGLVPCDEAVYVPDTPGRHSSVMVFVKGSLSAARESVEWA